MNYKSSCVLPAVRVKACLFPTHKLTTNISELINHVIKQEIWLSSTMKNFSHQSWRMETYNGIWFSQNLKGSTWRMYKSVWSPPLQNAPLKVKMIPLIFIWKLRADYYSTIYTADHMEEGWEGEIQRSCVGYLMIVIVLIHSQLTKATRNRIAVVINVRCLKDFLCAFMLWLLLKTSSTFWTA